jgi:hypothetical protein
MDRRRSSRALRPNSANLNHPTKLIANTIHTHSFIRNGRQDSAVPSGRDHVRLKVFPVQVKVQGPLTEELLRASREFTEETTAQKFRRRLREEPLIPLGMSFCSCSDLSLSNVNVK